MKGLIIEVLSGMNTSCKGCYDPKNIVYAEVSMNGDDTTFILGLIKCEGVNEKGKQFKCNCVPTIKKFEPDSTPTDYAQKDEINT